MVASISKPMNAQALEIYHSKDNYYSQDNGLENSQWQGKYAEHQNLSGNITKGQWQHACQGQDPDGNALRRQQKNSRAGWDITLSASKSTSLKALVDADPIVLEAHRKAVQETVSYIEQHCIHAQVKQQGKVISEQTRAGQFALFEHDDNRNQDPQLHTHVVILNQTLCQDGKSRTLDSRELFKQKKTIGAYYDHSFAYYLKEQGYQIDWTSDHTFEISGYEKDQLENFSSRRQDIREYLEERNIQLEKATEAQKQVACLNSRDAKVHKLTPADHDLQRESWQQTCADLNIVHPQPELEQSYSKPSHPGSLQTVIDDAIETSTQYRVAVTRQQLLRDCLRHAQDHYRPAEIEQALEQRTDLILTEDNRLTTEAVLKREQWIINSANDGQDKHTPLAVLDRVESVVTAKGLNSGQTNGLTHMATSTDQVVLVQGNAGVGKTYTLNAFRDCLHAEHQGRLRGLAPSSAAAGVLQAETGIASSTVDQYLLMSNERLEREQVLIVDEAGMLSTQQMASLIQKANDLDNRLILVGDTKQLSAVEAGAPFRLLQERSRLQTVTIDENLRQVTPQLKEAVDLAAEQKTTEALELLDGHDCVVEVQDPEERNQWVAERYLSRSHERQVQTLVICDTNADRQAITERIRGAYVEDGTLGAQSLTIEMLHPKNLDKHAIAQIYNYEVGDVVRFRQSTRRFPEPYYRVAGIDGSQLHLEDRFGAQVDCPVERYGQREVFSVQALELRVGDRLRFTRNYRDWGQVNGQLYTVDGLNLDGSVSINTRGKVERLGPEQLLHSDYAYCRTVYGAQGWTAQEAIWAPGLSPGREQAYVALSRARSELEVVTLDRQGLGLSAQRSRGQENAQDLIAHPAGIEFTDVELLEMERQLREWQRRPQPQPPDMEEGERLRERVAELGVQVSALELLCEERRLDLDLMGEPRSLFNWGGPSAEEVEAWRQLLRGSQGRLAEVNRELAGARNRLERWEQRREICDQWEQRPLVQRMREVERQLQRLEVRAHLAEIKPIHALHDAALVVLSEYGKPEDDALVFEGQRYRFMKRGTQLQIWQQGENKLLFSGLDLRDQAGSVDIRQMQMTDAQVEHLQAAAWLISQRNRELQYQLDRGGPSLG